MYDSIVIGAGVAGSVIARELAERCNKKVLVIEQREHIAGNCYDEYDENGILIHTYGPHIFHTNKKRVYEYLSRFTKWYPYSHEVVANVYGTYLPVPFNLNSLYQVYGEEKGKELEEKLKNAYGDGARVSILTLKENEDEEIQKVADYVYENVFLHYTMKQWGQTPDEIDPSVMNRVPVLISRDNRYFQDTWQGMPLDGYTKMFEAILNHENIEVQVGKKAQERIAFTNDQILLDGVPFSGEVIYTGPVDELFEFQYGRLPYRTLHFTLEHFEEDYVQTHGVVNYTVNESYTRITEFKHMTGQKEKGTTIMKEYPDTYTGEEGEIPYYAILNEENRANYEKYCKMLEKYNNIYLLGRLAEYQYYNIDAMVEKALELADKLEGIAK
ncbi:MAG TPA: UDP-galactopyranose mutase [Lachnospiraceae bacterium]|nr:UDP-galactopyranose mutase [Lachnospiraceae bacterium]